MTKQTAKLIWNFKYGEKPYQGQQTWDEVVSRVGISKSAIQKWWKKHGIEEKFTRKPHPQLQKVTDEEIVRNLSIDIPHQ